MSLVTNVNNVPDYANMANKAKKDNNKEIDGFQLLLAGVKMGAVDAFSSSENSNNFVSQVLAIQQSNKLDNLQATLTSMESKADRKQSLDAAMLIGKGVMIDGAKILVGQGTATPFGVKLPNEVESIHVNISDASGAVVRTLNLGSHQAGTHSFEWDARLDDGSLAADGAYNFSVTASKDALQRVAQPLKYAQVKGVVVGSDKEGPLLDLGNMESVRYDNINRILL